MGATDERIETGADPGDIPDGLVAGFLADLRELRITAGAPSYRVLATRAGIPRSTVHDALAGSSLPNRDVTAALVRALGGDDAEWSERWCAVRRAVDEPAAPDGPVEPPAPSASRHAWFGRRPRVVAGAVAVVLLGSGVAAGVALAGSDDAGCAHQSVYRVTGNGRVLDADGNELGRVSAGDTVIVRSTEHDAYPHRYRARVPGGLEGYVDEARLDFVRDTCA